MPPHQEGEGHESQQARTTIVIPLHPRGGKLRDDTELRFALRSLEDHFRGDFHVVLVGEKLPHWLTGVTHLPAGGLKSALVAAAAAYPEGFLWWYDDCTLLRDSTVEELKVTPCCRGWGKARTGWSRKLESIRQRLVAEGHKPWDYSRPHGPYFFDKGMVDEGFADWPGMASKFPWESWILSKRDWPRCHGAVKQYYGPFRGAPGDGARYLNYNDKGFSAELQRWLWQFFPRPSRFENDGSEVEWPEARVKLEVHTLRFGVSWWVQACAPTLDAWCERWGHPLHVWGLEDVDPSYPAAKFCEVDMLRKFLAGDAEWLLYVDADVYVHPSAPPHPDFSAGGFHIRVDRPSKFSRHFPRWVSRRFKGPVGLARSWRYRNAGIWACDRAAAGAMLAVIRPPYVECVQEQHHWNWWLAQAHHAGMPVHDLPAGWNAWPAENGKAAFFHLCGQKKSVKFNRLRDAGLIPNTAMIPTAAAFNFSQYAFAHCGSMMPMDILHIHLLHLTAGLDTGTPPGEKVAVEVGSHRGASTAALVEALNLGLIGRLHVVELRENECLSRVLAMAKEPERITWHRRPYWELEIGPADLVFIDGDHKWPAVADTLRALTWGAKVIAMHDSQSYPEISGTWGAKLAAGCLKDLPGRTVFEDAERREGMKTERGFLVSAAEGIDLSPLRSFVATAAAATSPV